MTCLDRDSADYKVENEKWPEGLQNGGCNRFWHVGLAEVAVPLRARDNPDSRSKLPATSGGILLHLPDGA